MTKDRLRVGTGMGLRALSRWEDEGGALAPTSAPDSIDESELRILARLGAALLEQWDVLPPSLQESVVFRAKTLGGPADHARIKEGLARFLRAHA